MKARLASCFIAIVMLGMLYSSAAAQVFSSCDQWASYTTNGYIIYNNIWGSGAGSQCLTVNSSTNWYVDANHSAGSGGVKSYPNETRDVNLNVDNMGSVTSTFSVTRPSGGSYSSTYDIWYNNYAYEIMLWMNYTGAVGPIAESYNCNGACPSASNVSIGGHTWNVYRGSNGSNQVFSFLRTSNTNSGTVDITAISQWLRTNGWFGNVNLHRIQFGFEITASSGNQRYSVTNFSVTTGSGGNSLTVSPTSLSVGSTSGSSTINVTSNVSWTVTDNQSWLSVSPASGSNNGSFSVTRTANTSSSSRSGTVTVTGGGITRTINVTQSGTSGCTPTAITPYVQINSGAWQQTANASLSVGGTVKFGPQPASGGSWSWAGPNGFSASTREVTISNIQTNQAGNYTATYTNTGGCQSTQVFAVTVGGGGSGTIVVRARGTQGGETIQLRTNNNTIATWTLTTTYQNYSASGSGAVTVQFTNDNGPRDVQVDYVTIGGSTYQAENQPTNTGVWQNSTCGGSNSEWIQCNGYISFTNIGKQSAPEAQAEKGTPEGFALKQNYPNPFNPETQIGYQLDEAGFVTLEIFDLLGRKVRTLVDGHVAAGFHEVRWNAATDAGIHVPSGMYLYTMKIVAGSRVFSETRRMYLVK